MLNFVLGTAKSGKSTYINALVKDISSSKKALLIVPEQFTLEKERELYSFIDKKHHSNVSVTSFSRLAETIFNEYGGKLLNSADESAKLVIMSLAIEQVSDMLNIYKKSAMYPNFALTMLDMLKEFKAAGVTELALESALGEIKQKYLHEKTSEILIIYKTYNALLYANYDDPLDNISRASKMIEHTSYFNGTTVFIDEFKSFTSNENSFLKQMIAGSDECYFALCLDDNEASRSSSSVFSSVYDTYNTLKRFATQMSIKIAPPIRLNGENHFLSDELYHLEQNIFRPVKNTYNDIPQNLNCVLCKNEYNEIDFALATISKLVQSGQYRYKDIAIISRQLDVYINGLISGFEKYNIPYFSDTREIITTMPIIRFVSCLINSVNFNTSNVLTMLKCGLFHFDIKDISELENYAYIWNISADMWLCPWVNNPRGFDANFTKEDSEALERINNIRSFVVDGLINFKNNSQDKNGKQLSLLVYDTLKEFDIINNYQEIIDKLYAQNNITLALKYEQVWEILIEILDILADTLKNTKVSLTKYLQYYNLIISSYTMGTIPQSLDSVLVGDAKRIRTNNPKIAFILGVTEANFPFVPQQSGLFTDKERSQLIDLNLNIAPPTFDGIKEERFIAYKAMSVPTKKLYLLSKKADVSGISVTPSVVFAQIKTLFPKIEFIDTDNLDALYYVVTKKTAFAALAQIYKKNSVQKASLQKSLSTTKEYEKKLARLDFFSNKSDFNLSDKKNIKGLFGNELNISPTRVQGYYECQFKYFCEHGLRIKPIRKAQLNPLEKGSLIHSVLENVTQKIDFSSCINKAQIKKDIAFELDEYIKTVMGGVNEKSGRFLYLYNKTANTLYKIIEQLSCELMQSKFTPSDYELVISDENDVVPLKLETEDGTKINIIGKIDRVDVYTDESGQKYVRIVDYKSGKKEFKLSDVYYGLNLQMLLYLFCICKNSKEKYKGAIPAGILYMPAGDVKTTLERQATESDVKKAKLAYYKMNGLLLDDVSVLKAMDKNIEGVFIPVELKKDGDFSKASLTSLASLAQLGTISQYLNKCIVEMACGLMSGKIAANPLPKTCEYCDYSSICTIKKRDTREKNYCNYSKDEAFEKIKKSVTKEDGFNGKN
ncbi:MAG: PD-(D/E)XK nuclease family protein [Oscillospiraceae bacterium]